MTMTPYIYCLTDPEPKGYYAQPGVYAVNLSFECVSGDEVEAAAEAAFKQFLDLVQGPIRFVSYRLEGGQLVEPVPVAAQLPNSQPTVAPNTDMIDWLRKRCDQKKGFWASQAQTGRVDAESAGAGALLRSVHAWNAPVGHRYGLTYVVRVDIEDDDILRVVVPIFGEADAPAPVGFTNVQGNPQDGTPAGTVDFVHNSGSGIEGLICRTVILGTPHEETLDSRLTADGYFKVNDDAIALRRLLTGFEHRAAGLLSITPALLPRGQVRDAAQHDEKEYEKLFQPGDGVLSPVAIWAAVTGLLTMLDNFVIALLKPLADRRTEGELLAPLINAITKAVADKKQPVPEREDLLQAIRQVLRQSPVFPSAAVAPGPAQISLLVPALRHVHGLSGAADASTSDANRLLLALLAKAQDSDAGYSPLAILQKPGDTQPMPLLAKSLSDLQTRLSEEAGAEATIIRLFETAVPTGSDVSVASLIIAYLPSASEELTKAVADGWTQYCALLNSPAFNGAEAVRHGAGMEFLNAIFLDEALRTPGGPTSKTVAERIRQASYFSRRLRHFDASGAPSQLMFDSVLDQLVYIKPVELPDSAPEGGEGSGRNTLERHLYRAYEATMRSIGDLSGEGERFVPDLSPQPLPLQIASDVTGEQFDDFLDDFNGIAVAISRHDPNGPTPFAHANLAELRWGDPSGADEPPLRVTAAIHPFLPSVNDGRGPAFVEYHGMSFADTSFATLLVDPAAGAGAGANVPARASYYTAALVSALDGQPPLPRLAYGRHFESYAFATTNAGTLPRLQHKSDDEPWLPGVPKRPTEEGTIAWAAYQRRTAIGEAEMLEVGPDGQSALPEERQRLNRAIPGVIALASDYPRRSLVAPPNGRATLELYRESDGIGTLDLAFAGRHRPLELAFADFHLSDVSGRLYLQLLDGPPHSPSDVAGAAWFELHDEELQAKAFQVTLSRILDGETEASTYQVSVSISWRAENGVANRSLGTFQAGEGVLFWLRVVLEAGAAPAAVSFASPDAPKGSRPTPSLLLLAPTDEGIWREDQVEKQVHVKISTPRVGYLDFQRWMANSTLSEKAFGSADLAARFSEDLQALYQMRHAAPVLARLFDRLPDPAVDRVRLTLCETDRLRGADSFRPLLRELDLTENLRAFRRIASHFTQAWPNSKNQAIEQLIKDFEQSFTFTLTLNSGTAQLEPPDSTTHERLVSVPAGRVAHLAIEALVPKRHFSAPGDTTLAPLHSGLLQYASSSTGDHFAFPLAMLCIETMADAIAERDLATRLVGDLIGLQAAASARRYDIVAAQQQPDEADRNVWRLYSHVTVHSQQWLYSGRPLYRTLKPKAFVWGHTAKAEITDAALRLQGAPEVFEFEGELFFDRSNINSDALTRRLDPLPARTVLQTLTWDSPSATYWRHRFTLKSRYAGALERAARGEVEAFPPIKEEKKNSLSETWTLRAAMLADLSRIQLTRPQLRALIPLTTAVAGGTPSVLAILQEPPLAHGGLADRISAELKTGFGYGFKSEGAPVEILDSRKEIGPDPTLTYSAMPSEAAKALTLMTEGPIGLTFDPPHASAPNFANSMFLLSPASLDGEPIKALEEYFLGITMQRNLDPDWLPDPLPSPDSKSVVEDSNPPSCDAGGCWWIEIPLKLGAGESKLSVLKLEPGTHEILELDRTNGHLALRVSKAALDGQPSVSESFVELFRLPIGTTRIALMHQPMTPGHYGLSIFAPGNEPDISRGHSGAWLRVASVEWSPPKGSPTTDAPRLHLPPSGAYARSTAASAATLIAWTRTHRDFANLTMRTQTQAEGGDSTIRAMVSDVIARRSGSKLTFHYPGATASLHLTSSTLAKIEPIERHRHLAFLLTSMRDEPGRPVEEFVHHGLFVGRTASVTALSQPSGRLNVRIIEIETRAVILCGTEVPGIPTEYRRRLLDLVATSGERASSQRITLFLRLAGSDDYVRRFSKIQVAIKPLKAGESHPESIVFTLDLGSNGVRAIELGLDPDQPYINLIGVDGQVIWVVPPEGMIAAAEALVGSIGLNLSIDTPAEAGECWCDVSMLHSEEGPRSGALDLRWLFSQDKSDEMEQALQPKAMAARTEAQGRIVSVSPPIPVEE